MNQPTVAVVGGGITGLATAWALLQANWDGSGIDDPFPPIAKTSKFALRKLKVILLEEDRIVGGKLRSLEIAGKRVDAGPDSFLATRPEAVELCRQVGLSEDLQPPAANKAYIWARGALRPIPPGLFLGLPSHLGPLARSGILDPMTLLRASLDLVLPRNWGMQQRDAPLTNHLLSLEQDGTSGNHNFDRSIGEIVSARLGRGVADNLVEPLVGGIHAGRIDNMSAAAVLPQLLQVASEHRSLILGSRRQGRSRAGKERFGLMRTLSKSSRTDRRESQSPARQPTKQPMFLGLADTLESLVQCLASELTDSGVELRTATPVSSIEPQQDGWEIRYTNGSIRVDAVVLATPAWVSGDLLKDLAPTASKVLREIEYSSISLVTFDLGEQQLPDKLADSSGFLVPSSPKSLLTACSFFSNKWKRLADSSHTLIRASAGRFGDDRCMQLDDTELASVLANELSNALHLPITPQSAVVTRWPNAFPQYTVGHLERMQQIKEDVRQLHAFTVAGAALGGVGIPACIAQGREAAKYILEQLAPMDSSSSPSIQGGSTEGLSSR